MMDVAEALHRKEATHRPTPNLEPHGFRPRVGARVTEWIWYINDRAHGSPKEACTLNQSFGSVQLLIRIIYTK